MSNAICCARCSNWLGDRSRTATPLLRSDFTLAICLIPDKAVLQHNAVSANRRPSTVSGALIALSLRRFCVRVLHHQRRLGEREQENQQGGAGKLVEAP